MKNTCLKLRRIILLIVLFSAFSTIARASIYDDPPIGPYVGFEKGISFDNSTENSIALGFRYYRFFRHDVMLHLRPAMEFEYKTIKTTNDLGITREHNVGVNAYLSFVPDSQPYIINLYLKTGIAKSMDSDLTNVSAGGGLGIWDILQMGFEYKHFMGLNSFKATQPDSAEVMVRLNIPFLIPFWLMS